MYDLDYIKEELEDINEADWLPTLTMVAGWEKKITKAWLKKFDKAVSDVQDQDMDEEDFVDERRDVLIAMLHETRLVGATKYVSTPDVIPSTPPAADKILKKHLAVVKRHLKDHIDEVLGDPEEWCLDEQGLNAGGYTSAVIKQAIKDLLK